MARAYFLLLVRQTGEPWEIAFGDYTRSTVEFERQHTSHVIGRNKRVLRVTGDTQADIDQAVRQANGAA